MLISCSDRNQFPASTTLYKLAQAFCLLVEQRQGEALSQWMEQARASDLPELRRFADSLVHDLKAIHAALCYEWSSGFGEDIQPFGIANCNAEKRGRSTRSSG
ncbi:MAG: transposase [Ktedonobacterales bacterium]|nr:transposase [Ktedonobacterales bacterium]